MPPVAMLAKEVAFRRSRLPTTPTSSHSGRTDATPPMMNRRELLALLAALGVMAIPTRARGQTRPFNILWRNGWAIVNIGDIGHVPGALALLRHYIPEATVTLWAQQDLVFRGAMAQRARFPDAQVDATTVSRKVISDLKVVYGRLDESGRADNPELEAAVAAASIMVVGSGAGVNAGADLLRFHARTSELSDRRRRERAIRRRSAAAPRRTRTRSRRPGAFAECLRTTRESR